MLIAKVVWRDANFGVASETPVAEIGSLVELIEVGIVLKETEDSVVLTMEVEGDLDERSTNRNWLTIPKVNIVSYQVCEMGEVFPPVKTRRRRKRGG